LIIAGNPLNASLKQKKPRNKLFVRYGAGKAPSETSAADGGAMRLFSAEKTQPAEWIFDKRPARGPLRNARRKTRFPACRYSAGWKGRRRAAPALRGFGGGGMARFSCELARL
jgi:hypothetical protein